MNNEIDSGSAPYTPASVGSAGSQYNGQSMGGASGAGESNGAPSSHHPPGNTSASDLDLLFFDDILFDTNPSQVYFERFWRVT